MPSVSGQATSPFAAPTARRYLRLHESRLALHLDAARGIEKQDRVARAPVRALYRSRDSWLGRCAQRHLMNRLSLDESILAPPCTAFANARSTLHHRFQARGRDAKHLLAGALYEQALF